MLSAIWQRSPAFWHQGPVSRKTIFPRTGVGETDGFGMIQAHFICCALYFYYYYIVIYNEIIMQLTIMRNQWEPWACFHLPLTDRVFIWVCKQLIYYVSVQWNLSANDDLYLQLLPRASITASAPPQIIRHWILIRSTQPRSFACAIHSRSCAPVRI